MAESVLLWPRWVAAIAAAWIIVFSAVALADTAGSNPTGELGARDCHPVENTTPLCFFSNPEDLALVPGEETLIVSEYGDYHGTQPGALSFYHYQKQQRRVAYDTHARVEPADYWGDPACDTSPGVQFSPHGIDLIERHDGRWQLLVVQHGGRESVEFFELTGAGESMRLRWRGCAIAPEGASLNSVAGRKEGGFFTTQMMSSAASWQQDQLADNRASGLVYRWSRSKGFQPVAGSEGVMLNGIAASTDGSTVYVAYSGEGLIKKIDTDGGGILASASVPAVDNIKWSADGRTLIAASFVGSVSNAEFARCTSAQIGICPIEFAIVELDPTTLNVTTLFQQPRAPMGAGTVGMKVENSLFIGTFSGNRLLEVDLVE